jgi:hypothetical protein
LFVKAFKIWKEKFDRENNKSGRQTQEDLNAEISDANIGKTFVYTYMGKQREGELVRLSDGKFGLQEKNREGNPTGAPDVASNVLATGGNIKLKQEQKSNPGQILSTENTSESPKASLEDIETVRNFIRETLVKGFPNNTASETQDVVIGSYNYRLRAFNFSFKLIVNKGKDTVFIKGTIRPPRKVTESFSVQLDTKGISLSENIVGDTIQKILTGKKKLTNIGENIRSITEDSLRVAFNKQKNPLPLLP